MIASLGCHDQTHLPGLITNELVRPCPSHDSPADLAKIINSVAVRRCGNRECDFQPWSQPGVICRPVRLHPAAANIGGRYFSFWASTAHAMRAHLFAKTTPAKLRWVRDGSWASQRSRTRCSDCRSSWWIGLDRHEAHRRPCHSLTAGVILGMKVGRF